jgi:hypothetical protein
LDVLSKILALVLTHRLEVVFHGGALVHGREIGDELPAQILPRGDRLVQKVHDPSSHCILEGHGEPVGHDVLISMSGLEGDDVELEEFDGVGRSAIMRTNARPELVRLDYVALLVSESEAPKVLDELAGDLDVLARLADVINGAVMIFSAALKRDACIFRSALDNLTAWLTTWR